jgi:tetratricopeptide (TPR) repeat protein/DNA-binding XRE family transcriptional regulator
MVTAMLDSRYKGRRKGVAVRAGSVRQARLEASLSLAQVAAGHVSRTAIHLIEYGRVKPSLETLRVIARQTRKPISYFLLDPDAHPELTERHKELRELETLTLARDFAAVVKLGLALLDKRWADEDLALTRFYLGQAYCRLVQPEEALLHLSPARAQFERQEDELLAVDALDWEASALGLLEDPKATALANLALERCRKIDPTPQQLEARILGHLANMFVVAESWGLAISHYQAAVDAASAVKDLLQLAKMHHGLGLAYLQLRQPSTARRHFDLALALYSMESDASAVYRVENDLGNLLLHEGHVASAERHFLTALAGAEELGMNRRGRGFILANLGEVCLKQGRLDEARSYFNQSLEVGEAFGERIVLTVAGVLLGQLEEGLGNTQAADNHFLEALRILEELEMPNRLRDCHLAYAQVLEARGELRPAIHHMRLAAELGRPEAVGIPIDRPDDQTTVLREHGRSVS